MYYSAALKTILHALNIKAAILYVTLSCIVSIHYFQLTKTQTNVKCSVCETPKASYPRTFCISYHFELSQ